MIRHPHRPVACLLAAVLAFPAVHAQAPVTRATPPESAVDAIFKSYDSTQTPGCSVAVIDGGKRLLEKSYGMADIALDVPRTSRTSHWIPYSEARVFVALAVAILAREGRIGLDDPVRTHLPELPAYTARVTVRHLLHHTSGLADYGVLDPGFDSMWSRVSEDELFRVLSRWGKLGFAPGQGSMYSNTDYALLEMLVKRVTGATLHDALHARLLGPLGMADTRIGADQAVVRPGHALFYEPDGDGFRRVFPYRTSPVGGISVTTSLEDLVRWDAALRDPERGLAAMLAQLEAGAPPPAADASPDVRGFAFGVFRRTYKGLPLVEYHGVGDYTYLVQVPGTRLSVATLCNSYTDMWSMGADVARLYAVPAPSPAAEIAAAAAPAPTVGPVVEVPDSELQRYAGEYRNAGGQAFTIAVAGKGLSITPRGGDTMPPVLPVGDGQFRTQLGASTYLLTFKADDGEMVMSTWDITANESGGQELRRRSTPAWVTPANVAAYAGRYAGEDIEAVLHVRVDGDRVLVGTRGRPESALEPDATPDRFTGPDIYKTRFERDGTGRVVALVLDATRVKGMRYLRE